MKVILTERVKNLGNLGEIVRVSAGFARNYLIPSKLAMVADKSTTKMVEDQKRRLQKKIQAEQSQAQEAKKQIDGLTLEFMKKVGGSGKLFGTVTTSEIADELSKKGVDIEKRQVIVTTPIKTLGNFKVGVKLFTDVEASLNIKVVMDQNQAEEIRQKQALAEKRAQAKKSKAAKGEETEEAAASEEQTQEEA